ncbi:MAG: helix-turn-helix domain-containing protein [Solirubrobacterales bacterium]|nr:helix-turn-helix domain-containing protein [Solirubrobacterales bacterium]
MTHRPAAGAAEPDDDLERIAATPPELLVSQLPSDPAWDMVAGQPRRWLAAYVRAAGRACEGLREPWRAASGLLDREAERVGLAAVLGTQRELIAARVPECVWRVESAAPQGADPPVERLRMVPALAGPGSTHAWTVDGELSQIVYLLPGAWRLLDGEAPPPAELDGLLGSQRALILRHLDRAVTAGQIAEALIAVPSAASHHLAILERAGLVERERRGRNVLVRRTTRGSEILALYDDR